ncbi:MAG: hypothetical protein V7K89_12410 [Nostoc sp.]
MPDLNQTLRPSLKRFFNLRMSLIHQVFSLLELHLLSVHPKVFVFIPVVYLRTVFGSDCTHLIHLYIKSKDNCLKAIAHVEFVENYNRQLLFL